MLSVLYTLVLEPEIALGKQQRIEARLLVPAPLLEVALLLNDGRVEHAATPRAVQAHCNVFMSFIDIHFLSPKFKIIQNFS